MSDNRSDAYHVGFYSHAWGLAKRFTHLHWPAVLRAEWSQGYRDSGRQGAFGRYGLTLPDVPIPSFVTNTLKAADAKFGIDPL